jgi:hypothetical protein
MIAAPFNTPTPKTRLLGTDPLTQWPPDPDEHTLLTMSRLRRFWPILALLAGAALLFFELRRDRAVTAENAFWLLIGGLVLILGAVDLWQSLHGRRPSPDRSNPDPPGPV